MIYIKVISAFVADFSTKNDNLRRILLMIALLSCLQKLKTTISAFLKLSLPFIQQVKKIVKYTG